LRVPPGAAKARDLSFLEGCWCTTLPDADPDRIERICLDGNGNGKTTMEWKNQKMKCISSTKALFDAQGRLILVHNQGGEGACTDGRSVGQTYAVCEEKDNSTFCLGYPGPYTNKIPARPGDYNTFFRCK